MHANQSDDGTGTISRKFVKLMAKKFEQIGADSYISSHEANFKQCNWWLDMPTSATCFDDLGQGSEGSGGGVGAGDGGSAVGSQFSISVVAPVTHAIPFETAEIANEFQSIGSGGDDSGKGDDIDGPLSIDNHPDKADFLQQINQCLRFPSSTKTAHSDDSSGNEKIR